MFSLSFIRHPDAVPHRQVGEDASAIGAVDDGRRAVRGVHQQAGRLSMRSRDKGDAGYASNLLHIYYIYNIHCNCNISYILEHLLLLLYHILYETILYQTYQ